MLNQRRNVHNKIKKRVPIQRHNTTRKPSGIKALVRSNNKHDECTLRLAVLRTFLRLVVGILAWACMTDCEMTTNTNSHARKGNSEYKEHNATTMLNNQMRHWRNTTSATMLTYKMPHKIGATCWCHKICRMNQKLSLKANNCTTS
jgi:hypothetical protein